MNFPLVFISSTLEIVSGEKETFTANFAQSAENNIDPFFKNSDIYIPHNSLIIPLRVLAKYTFLVIIFFSNIEIDLYSFYRKNLIATPKIRDKIDKSAYSFTRKRRFISLSG